jgi:hypothetical protein
MGTGNLAAVMIDQFLRRQDVLGTPARVPGLERETSTRRARDVT